jgi:AhpD family alkylhydroperoxidase
MHMLDWNTYRQQLLAGVGSFGKLNPDIIKGYTTLSRAGQKAGHLDEKTRELVALAVAITLRCDGCITVHTAEARERGATREEIAEVLGVAISVNAGAAVVYSTRALDAFDAAAEINLTLACRSDAAASLARSGVLVQSAAVIDLDTGSRDATISDNDQRTR